MLVALHIQKRHPHGWRHQIRERFRRHGEVRSHFVSLPGGHYIQLEADCNRRGRVDWPEVRRVAGSEATRLLLPKRLSPPADSGLAPFAGNALRQALMLQTALHLLETLPVLSRCPVVMYDPQARHAALTEQLVPLAADLRIVTARPAAYRPAVEAAMARYGACLPLTDDRSCLAEAALILAPNGIDGPAPISRGWVLSGVDQPRPRTITGYIPASCASYSPFLPPGCDIWDFLAGLYELSGIRCIGEEPPLTLCAGSQHLSIGDLSWQLTGLDIGISV